jgi:hypothetical protein
MCKACRWVSGNIFCKGMWQRDNTVEPIVVPKLMVTPVTLIGKKNVGLRV